MTKILHIFTEEPSAKNVFEILLPKILPKNVSFRVYPHQGKQDLERAIKKTIPSIGKTFGARILITRDQDSSDCLTIKKNIEKIINDSACYSPYFIRIICKELEASFLGDLLAVSKAFPRLKPEQYFNKTEMKNVDEIISPNNYLLNIIPEFSEKETLPKLETSQMIAMHMSFENNRSQSFNHTFRAIQKLLED